MTVGKDGQVGAVQARVAAGELAELGGGDRAALEALHEAQLALGEDPLGAELLRQQMGRGGAAQPVVDRARRDDGERQAEAGVAQAGAGGAQEAGLAAEQVEALEQAALDAGGDAAVGGGLADIERSHHVADRDDAVAPYKADQLTVATVAPVRRDRKIEFLEKSHP